MYGKRGENGVFHPLKLIFSLASLGKKINFRGWKTHFLPVFHTSDSLPLLRRLFPRMLFRSNFLTFPPENLNFIFPSTFVPVKSNTSPRYTLRLAPNEKIKDKAKGRKNVGNIFVNNIAQEYLYYKDKVKN